MPYMKAGENVHSSIRIVYPPEPVTAETGTVKFRIFHTNWDIDPAKPPHDGHKEVTERHLKKLILCAHKKGRHHDHGVIKDVDPNRGSKERDSIIPVCPESNVGISPLKTGDIVSGEKVVACKKEDSQRKGYSPAEDPELYILNLLLCFQSKDSKVPRNPGDHGTLPF
jgi:hypothetical protein